VLAQVSDTRPPMEVVLGLAVRVTVGRCAEPATTTVTVCEAMPPDPLQLSVKLLSAVIGPVEAEPLSGRGPVHPPEARQESASEDVHVSVEATPSATVVGWAVSETLGVRAPESDPVERQPEPQPSVSIPIATSIVKLLRVSMVDLPLPHVRVPRYPPP